MHVRFLTTLLATACIATICVGSTTKAQPVEVAQLQFQSPHQLTSSKYSLPSFSDGVSPLFKAITVRIFRTVSCLLGSNENIACSTMQTASIQFVDEDTTQDVVLDEDEEEDDDDDDDDLDLSTDQHAESKSGWIYLIRHGEKFKDSDHTGLSPRGIKRARCLPGVFDVSEKPIDFILAQDYRPDGRRKRPFDTVVPLAKALDVPLDHTCDREDTRCVARKIHRHAVKRGENVLVAWEHARLTKIAQRLGITGLQYPSKRYDVVFKIRDGKVHAIFSEECRGLDEQWFGWYGKKKGKHGKGGKQGRLIDDDSWADSVLIEPDTEED